MDKQETFNDCVNDGFINGFFSKEEIDKIDNIKPKDRAHPLKQLMSCNPSCKGSYVIENTNSAYKQLRKDGNHMRWLENQKARFLEQDNFFHSLQVAIFKIELALQKPETGYRE